VSPVLPGSGFVQHDGTARRSEHPHPFFLPKSAGCPHGLMSVDKSKEVKMGDYSGSVLTWAMIKKDDVEIIFQREDRLIEEIPEFKDMKI